MTRETLVGPRVEVEVEVEVMGGRLEAPPCSCSLVARWLASVEMLVKWCCRVRGLTSPFGDG